MNCIRENGVTRGQIPNLRRPDVARTRVVAIALPPTKYLVRIHVVMPSNH